jgi:predicted nucleic-acid-binding protein
MLAIDTNLIVRYLVGDDAIQAARARKLIDGNAVFVCTTVLLETEWVLRSAYDYSEAQRAKALGDFAGLPRVTLEDPDAVTKALGWMQKGLDFADGLHLAKAEDCDAFVTFDREFAKTAQSFGGPTVRTP